MSEEYDLIPHGKLKRLEEQIDELKHPGSGRTSSNTVSSGSMDGSMKELSESLKTMITVFSEAKDELRIEDEEKELLSNKIDPILKKLDSLLDQNEKIAEGILSLADMIRKVEGRIDSMDSDTDRSASYESSHEDFHKESQSPLRGMQNQSNESSNTEAFKSPSTPLGMNMNSSPFGNQNQQWGSPTQQGQAQTPPPGQSQQFGDSGMFGGKQQFSNNPASQTSSANSSSGVEDPFGQPLQSSSQQSSPFGSKDSFSSNQSGNQPSNQSANAGGFDTQFASKPPQNDAQESQAFGMPPPPPSPKKKGFFGK